MSAALHLGVLVFLLTVCSGSTFSSLIKQGMASTTSAAHSTSSAPSSSVDATTTLQSQTGTHQFSSQIATVSPLTPKMEKTSSSPSQPTTLIPPASDTTVSQQQTVPSTSGSPNTTESTIVNTTSPALLPNWGKDDLAANPGLVAIICIFCIILVLVLVVLTVKCIRLPRSNFERLDDVPMGKVNEESPFAHYSK